MKNKLFSGAFLSVLALGLLAGVLVFSISLLPYDALSPLVNDLASDGSVDSFSRGNRESISRIFRFDGGGLVSLCGAAWMFRPRVESWMQNGLFWSKGFFIRTRDDAQIFIIDFLPVFQKNNERLLIAALTLVGLVPRLANLFILMEFDEAYLYNAFASHSFWDVVTDYHVPNNHIFLTIIALFPILVKNSVLVRGYAFIRLFTLLLILLADYVRTHKKRFAWAAFILFCVLGFYTVPVMLLSAGAVYVWLFLSLFVCDIHSCGMPFEL